jgi:hypothetical protein
MEGVLRCRNGVGALFGACVLDVAISATFGVHLGFLDDCYEFWRKPFV